MCNQHKDCQENPNNVHMLSRRDLLRAGIGAGAGIIALGPLARRSFAASMAPTMDTRLVVINMFGGNDGLNMVIPTPGTAAHNAYINRRPTLGLQGANVLTLNGNPGVGLHASMPNLRTMYNNGDLAIVNKVGYPGQNESHFESMDIFSTGRTDVLDMTGGLGVTGWVAKYSDLETSSPMGSIAVGVGNALDFQGSSVVKPASFGSLSNFNFVTSGLSSPDVNYAKSFIQGNLNSYPNSGQSGASSLALKQGQDLADQIQQAITSYNQRSGLPTYPNTGMGNRLRDIARIFWGGFPTRIAYTGYGGFDTHAGQGQLNGAQPQLFQQLDQAMQAFMLDLQLMGIWNKVVVLVVSEFGRRNYENASGGTDHGRAIPFLLAGGAVNTGFFGPAYSDVEIQNADTLAFGVDFRSVYKELLTTHLGVSASNFNQIITQSYQHTSLGVV